MRTRNPFGSLPHRMLGVAVHPPFALGVLAVGMLALSACDSRVVYGTSGDRTAWGDYTVRSANDQSLPATIRRGSTSRTEVLAGSLTLERDGDCRARFTLRVTTLGVTSTVERSEGCRWTQNGDQLRLWWDDNGATATARYANDARITLYDDDDTFVFTR